MLCKWCQRKVARKCHMAMGRSVPMDALPCDFNNECNVTEYAQRIIEIFQPERSKREDILTFNRFPSLSLDNSDEAHKEYDEMFK